MSDWRDDGPLLGWTYETQGESTAYCWGAAVAFGLMGMAEAIGRREALKLPEWGQAQSFLGFILTAWTDRAKAKRAERSVCGCGDSYCGDCAGAR